jgi:hypothetical protein
MILLAITSPRLAAQTKPEMKQWPKQFMVYDAGQRSCGFWLEVRAAREKPQDFRFVQFREWLSGFISAYNYNTHSGTIDVAAGTDREGMYAWLDDFCRNNPTSPFIGAAIKLIEHLQTR